VCLDGAQKQKTPQADRFAGCLVLLKSIARNGGAQERTRTSTVLPPPGPEPGASTNSATWARFKLDGYCSGMVQRVDWYMQIDLQLTAIRFAALLLLR
jgi:hypothetical protein